VRPQLGSLLQHFDVWAAALDAEAGGAARDGWDRRLALQLGRRLGLGPGQQQRALTQRAAVERWHAEHLLARGLGPGVRAAAAPLARTSTLPRSTSLHICMQKILTTSANDRPSFRAAAGRQCGGADGPELVREGGLPSAVATLAAGAPDSAASSFSRTFSNSEYRCSVSQATPATSRQRSRYTV
jgi:hypothetical protein